MKFLMLFGLASVASAHTLFTTLFINGENQGDGTCVRMPKDGSTATSPVEGIKGDDMACGTKTPPNAFPPFLYLIHPTNDETALIRS